jgi:type III pantothenate kinase
MRLLIDIGNSRIKWCELVDGQLTQMHAAVYDQNSIAEWCAAHLADRQQPDAVLVSNVAGAEVSDALTAWCRDYWRLNPWFARTEQRAAGITNGYTDSNQLGVDRWLALIAVRRLTTAPACAISCGTAVTMDVMNAAGEHLGGVIAPGLELMRTALNAATLGARTTGPLFAGLALGRSTESGIAGGGSYAIVGLIERVIADLHQQLAGNIQCYMTGGGAGSLAPLCRLPVPVRVIDDLVLQGLVYYAEE